MLQLWQIRALEKHMQTTSRRKERKSRRLYKKREWQPVDKELRAEATNNKCLTCGGNGQCQLKIKTKIAGIKNEGLIDCGAMCCLAHSKLKNCFRKIMPTSEKLITADKQPLRVHGKAESIVTIKGRKYEALMYIVDNLAEDVILGTDFFKQHEATLCWRTDRIEIGKQGNRISMEMNIKNQSESQTTRLQLEKDVTIKPGESIKIKQHPITTIKKDVINQTGLDIQTNCSESELIITNNTTKAKRIKKNMLIHGRKNEKREEYPRITYDNKIRVCNINRKTVMRDKDGQEVKGNSGLNTEHDQMQRKLINEFIDNFASEINSHEKGRVPEQRIEMNQWKPVRKGNYSLGIHEEKMLLKKIDEMEKANIIKQKKSEWESPVFLKKKPDGSYRPLVDYREANKQIKKDNNRVPKIDLMWPKLRDARYFTTMDLNGGFFQIPLEEESKDITGITVGGIGYVFNVIPQGLTVSPSIFQTVMVDIFKDLIRSDKMMIYLDDICIFGKTFEETYDITREAMLRLKEHNLKLKTSKCNFFAEKIELLGYTVSYNKLETLNKNTEAIRKAKPPKTVKQIKRFLGMTGFYRKMVKNYSKIAAPLSDLTRGKDTKQNSKVKLGQIELEAYEKLKEIITSNPVLQIFNDEEECILEVDASKIAVGAVLTQINRETGLRHPIGYFSKKMPKAKKELCSFDLEMIAITASCHFFRHYLVGRNFTIHTDHMPLTFQARFSTPSARLARLLSKLSEFTFDIRHIKGKDNIVADYLSRIETDEEEKLRVKNGKYSLIQEKGTQTSNKAVMKIEIKQDKSELSEQQKKDPYWRDMKKALKGQQHQIDIDKRRKIMREKNKYEIDTDEVIWRKANKNRYFNRCPVIPDTMVNDVMKQLHEDETSGGHFGINKTIKKIKDRCYFKDISKKVRNWIKTCHSCQINKNKQEKYGLLQPIVAEKYEDMGHLQIDYVGKLPKCQGKEYFITAIDKASRYAWAKAVKHPDAESTIKFLQEIMNEYGIPNRISCDNGTHFSNEKVHDFCKRMGIEILHSTSYSPQSQGQVEKLNGILKERLKCQNMEKWATNLKNSTFAYNITPMECIDGNTPFFLIHGFEARIPTQNGIPNPKTTLSRDEKLEIIKKAKLKAHERTLKEAGKYKAKYDTKRKPLSLGNNDLVLVRRTYNMKKGEHKYDGPYRIIKKIGKNGLNYMVKIKTSDGRWENDVIHVRRLIPYHQRAESKNHPPPIQEEEGQTTQLRRKRGRPPLKGILKGTEEKGKTTKQVEFNIPEGRRYNLRNRK